MRQLSHTIKSSLPGGIKSLECEKGAMMIPEEVIQQLRHYAAAHNVPIQKAIEIAKKRHQWLDKPVSDKDRIKK